VTLPYSGESFLIPANVDIIGTMNTADRSLALLDTALRRRFEFVPVMPDTRDVKDAPLDGLRVAVGEKVINIPLMLGAINQRIEALYDCDHRIGHAYFTSLKSMQDGEDKFLALSEIFSKRVIPLLEEYFFEDKNKIRLVLGDNQKARDAQFIVESTDSESHLEHLFGANHGLDSYAIKSGYSINSSAFSNPDAYIGIYSTLTK
jgi:5-methylcytosine-specific restriction protein B